MILLLMSMPALAQSCALCYTQAASSGAHMIQALRSGILILIAPPTFMSIGLIFVCYNKRNKTRRLDHRNRPEDNREQDNREQDNREEDYRGKDSW